MRVVNTRILIKSSKVLPFFYTEEGSINVELDTEDHFAADISNIPGKHATKARLHIFRCLFFRFIYKVEFEE